MRIKQLVIFFTFLITANVVSATDYTPEMVQNPRLISDQNWVANPDGVLSAASVTTLNQKITALEQKNGVEIGVAALGSIEGDEENAFANQLFNTWKIGKEGKNSGVLILLVTDIRAVKIETGVGVEGILPDAFCNEVLEKNIYSRARGVEMETLIKDGTLDSAMVGIVDDLSARLTTDEAMGELLLNTSSPRVQYGSWLANYLMFAFLVLIVYAIISYRKMRNLHGNNNEKYKQMYTLMNVAICFAIFLPLPMAFFARYLKRKRREIRFTPMNCAKCGATMQFIPDNQQDKYLSASEKVEEKLKSVDYDIWLCPKCQNTLKFPYKSPHTEYEVCPQCGAITFHQTGDRIISQATTRREGQGCRTYTCAFCKHQKLENYTIPRQETPVVVAGGRGGHSIGGSGFGGGFSGGGGAGGRF
jgi:uncharacterized protein